MTAKIIPIRRAKVAPRHPAEDPILEFIGDAIAASGLSRAEIAKRSGVTYQTLRRWETHQVKRPQHLTVRFVANACGWDESWVQTATGKRKVL